MLATRRHRSPHALRSCAVLRADVLARDTRVVRL